MEEESYWYYINGRLKQHLNPPLDPSSTTFAHVKITDAGFETFKSEITLCVEGKYLKPKIITTVQYKTPIKIRERSEITVKDMLKEHRTISNWGITNSKKRCKK